MDKKSPIPHVVCPKLKNLRVYSMKLTNFIVEAQRAVQMEDAIVTAWNTKAPYWPRAMTISREVPDNVVHYLKAQGVQGKRAKKVARKQVSITKQWTRYGGVDNTPKTDILIGAYRLSLKTGPRSRLMSGGKGESAATFYNILDRVDLKDSVLIDTISSMLDQWESKIIGAAPLGKEKRKNAMIKQAEVMHREMTTILDNFFSTNKDFRNAFAREAMTGEIKFGKGSPGHANYILKVLDPFSGKKNTLNDCSNSAYIAHIAKQMNLKVEWKSTKGKGQYRYWSVLSLALDKMNEEFDKYEGLTLNEGIISAILTKIKVFLSKLIDKLKEYISKGVEYVIEFLDITPDITVNEEVIF
jgi:hypothetical protein